MTAPEPAAPEPAAPRPVGVGIDPAAAAAAEVEYAGRLLEREGIPMVLALIDETAAPEDDGVGHAELLRAYREVLRPGAADDDATALQDVLAVLSWVHRPGGAPVPARPELPSFGQHAAALAAGRFLRVVNYHNTPAGSEEQLERELAAYLAEYDPVTPADLDAFFDTGRWRGDRPGFVAAFYDGYYNHATVAAPVCDRLGLRAWFLPPTAFLDTPTDGQHEFAERQDFWVLDEERDQDRLAMSWADLAAIAERHEIVAHTGTHASAEQALADPAGELAGPRRRIEEVTGRAPEAVVFRLGAPWAAPRTGAPRTGAPGTGGARTDAAAGGDGTGTSRTGTSRTGTSRTGAPRTGGARTDAAAGGDGTGGDAAGGDVIRDAGYRFVVSNTAIQRIARP